jgi:hypothetical protein
MSQELERCPWCGWSIVELVPERVTVATKRLIHVMCTNPTCRAMGPCRDTKADASRAWNTIDRSRLGWFRPGATADHVSADNKGTSMSG